MNLVMFALILCSVSCSAVAQILLKTGMSRQMVVSAMSDGQAIKIALAIALNPWVVGGLGLYFVGAVVWLFVLARAEVSYAYPFVAVGFVLTLLLGRFVMGDAVTVARIVGTVLVGAGVVLIARQ